VKGTLKSRARLQQLFETGKRIRGRNALLLYSKLEGPWAFAFIAGKRLGGAVVRNRAKRRLRAAAAYALAKWTPSEGAQLVLLANARTLKVPFEALVEDLCQILAQSGCAAREAEKA